MNYLKFIFINIFAFGFLITIISLLFPSHIQSAKMINVAGNSKKIISKIEDTKSWKEWNVFAKDDTSLQNIITKIDTSKVVIAWSNKADMSLSFKMEVYPTATDSTPINFVVTQKLKWYPWEKFGALVSNKAIENALEISLDSLKKQIEFVK